jgi:serine/threonine protein kinase
MKKKSNSCFFNPIVYIFRDLKPDNILLDEKGHAHLSDFNIAVQFNKRKSHHLTSVAGSLAYISPEILKKQGYSFSVDWWSLGIVIYELLYGQVGFFFLFTYEYYHAYYLSYKRDHSKVNLMKTFKNPSCTILLNSQRTLRSLSTPWLLSRNC